MHHITVRTQNNNDVDRIFTRQFVPVTNSGDTGESFTEVSLPADSNNPLFPK